MPTTINVNQTLQRALNKSVLPLSARVDGKLLEYVQRPTEGADDSLLLRIGEILAGMEGAAVDSG